MKLFCRWLGLSWLMLGWLMVPAAVQASEDVAAAVRAADDARVAAMASGGRGALEAILSDDLRYAHSNGKVDTKASLMATLESGKTVYEGFEYRERSFIVAAPTVVLMPGRAIVHVRNGEQKLALDLNFLAVWRLEDGRWRFLAWQSCRAPEPK